MMAYYPIFLDIGGRKVTVVGGGQIAERKIKQLVDCGAIVKVVSSKIRPGIKQLAAAGLIEVLGRDFTPGDLEGAYLAIAATDNPQVNKQIAQEAREGNILVNVASELGESSFIFPAVIRRGDLVIAISTSGLSPALARMVKEELEQNFIGQEYATLVEIVSKARSEFRQQGKQLTFEAWQKSIDSEVLELIKEGEIANAKERLVSNLEKRC
jgi:precorrin-2 dehydrogenase/sirohydrochlorin ferrochelatase